MRNPLSKAAREEREAEQRVRRDATGAPVTCDCPDGADHPCDGKGWCGLDQRPEK